MNLGVTEFFRRAQCLSIHPAEITEDQKPILPWSQKDLVSTMLSLSLGSETSANSNVFPDICGLDPLHVEFWFRKIMSDDKLQTPVVDEENLLAAVNFDRKRKFAQALIKFKSGRMNPEILEQAGMRDMANIKHGGSVNIPVRARHERDGNPEDLFRDNEKQWFGKRKDYVQRNLTGPATPVVIAMEAWKSFLAGGPKKFKFLARVDKDRNNNDDDGAWETLLEEDGIEWHSAPSWKFWCFPQEKIIWSFRVVIGDDDQMVLKTIKLLV